MNYFNYFTEIEEHFQRQRGVQTWLSPLDWALIESWRDAGIPLPAVLAGIDQAFEKFEQGRRRDKKPRALVYCAAAVLDAAEAMQAAAVGAASPGTAAERPRDDAFAPERIAAHLRAGAAALAACRWLDPAAPAVAEITATLQRLASGLGAAPDLQELDRVLSVLDDKLLALLQQAAPVEAMVGIRAEVERELAPYRRQMRVEQLAMIERQFMHRRLLEQAGVSRLSLFYL